MYAKTAPITPPASEDELPTPGEFELLPSVTKKWPAGKPYTYKEPSYPSYPDSDTPSYPGAPSHPHYPTKPGSSSPPYPSSGSVNLPWLTPEQEDGYCVTETTIHFVDEAGTFLYAEKQY